MMVLRPLLVLLSALLLVTCSKEKRYSVPAEVEVHVQKFIEEGNARGVDIEIKRLIVTMVDDLESDGNAVAGRCLNPGARKPKIELDANFSNLSYEVQEQLIFHELGHCILDRGHKDAFLSNGHYNSLMNSFFWNYIAGQDFKRAYYLDELFDEDATEPSWTAPETTHGAVTSGMLTPLFTDEFDNGNSWNMNTTQNVSINNGNLRIRTDCDTNFGFLRNFNINPGKDYQIEARMKIISDNDQTNALMWSMEGDLNYFGMNKNKETSIGILDAGEAVVTAHPCGTSADDYNIYTIRIIDDKAYFFINHNFLDYRIIPSHQVLSLGFLIGNAAITEIDYLYVNEITL